MGFGLPFEAEIFGTIEKTIEKNFEPLLYKVGRKFLVMFLATGMGQDM
jgi:hypothetical protein